MGPTQRSVCGADLAIEAELRWRCRARVRVRSVRWEPQGAAAKMQCPAAPDAPVEGTGLQDGHKSPEARALQKNHVTRGWNPTPLPCGKLGSIIWPL